VSELGSKHESTSPPHSGPAPHAQAPTQPTVPQANQVARSALSLAASAREAFVLSSCNGDEQLLTQVRALLRQAEAVTSVSGFTHEQPAAIHNPSDGHLTRLGSYTIMGLLGEGGMGHVYLAEQDRPRRTVALKIMRRGSVSPALLRRFEHESQMLARLQHPGIAQIYEAATAQTPQGPLPFFAMEYVKGRSLIEHAFALNLSTRDRMSLFVRVCGAVQHAHQNGVIHRDLKPANIIVDNTGQPKVLDFGIARSTDADLATLHTQAGQVIGTVPYMSPEQIAGDPNAIDTRSDVYALGVILFELLTGRLPLAVIDRPMAEAARMIQFDEPVGIGSVDRTLRGDIQTIVGKALEKDRTRRYQSASDLEADIERFLRDEPILARAPSITYQLSKFARRNRAFVGGVCAAVLLLVAGATATSWQAVLATRGQHLAEQRKLEADAARSRAQSDAQNAKNASAFIADMLNAVNPEEGNAKDITVLEMVDRAAQRLRDDVSDDVNNDRNKDVNKDVSDDVANVTTPPRSLASTHHTAANPYVRMSAHNTLSSTYRALGRVSDAIAQARSAVNAALQLGPAYELDAISAKRTLAMAISETADYEAVESLTRECLAALEALQTAAVNRSTPVTANARDAHTATINDINNGYSTLDARTIDVEHAMTLGELGRVQHLRGRYAESEATIRRTLELLTRLVGESHPDVLTNLDHLGITCLAQNKFAEAIATLEHTRALREKAFGPDSAVTAYTLNNLANAYQRSGDNAKALELLTRVVTIRQALLPPRHPSLLVSMSNLAVALTTAGRFKEAQPLLRESLEAQIAVLGEAHPKTMLAMGNLAFVCEDLGELDEAEKLFRQVVTLRRRVGLTDPQAWPQLNNLAMLLAKRNKLEEAAEIYAQTVSLSMANAPANDLSTAIFRSNYGECLTRLGRTHEAADHLAASHATLTALLKPDHPRIATSLRRQADLAKAIESSLEVAEK